MSSFIYFNSKESSAETKYSAEVIKNALLKAETKNSAKADNLVKDIKQPVALNEALMFFTDKLGAIKQLGQSIIEVNEGRVKQFETDYADMEKSIKRGIGWIDPEYVEDTWENSSDSIDFELVKTELYKRLINAGLLAFSNPEDGETKGVPVRSLKDLNIKESLVSEAYGKSAGLSKEETLEVAQKFADAMSKVDGTKVTVNKRTLEEDSFDLDVDGEEFDGGSYNIYQNGNVMNMALRENPVYGKKNDSVDTIVKNMKKIMSESTIVEKLSVTDERVYGKRGIIIMIDDNGKQVSAIFKDKKNADKYNRNKEADLLTLLDLAKNTKYPNAIDESIINEAYEVHYSDGVRAFKKFGNEGQALAFAKDLIKNKKGLQFVDVFKAGSGFHSTAETDAIVAFWGDRSYTDNVSKSDAKLAAKKINEEVNEAEVDLWSEVEGDFTQIYSKLNDLVEETTDSKWRKAIEGIIKALDVVETKMGQASSKLGVITVNEADKYESVNEGVRISLFDPNKNKILKSLSVDKNYKEAEKEVETLNKRLSASEKNKEYYWKITTIGESATNEAFYRMSSDTVGNELYAASQALTTYYDWLQAGNDSGEGKSLDHIIDLLKKCKNSIKKFNKAAEVKGTAYESVVTEGRSINKIQKEWSETTTAMSQKVEQWKSAEGDRKIELLDELKALTAKKRSLESELDAEVAGKDKDLELVVSEGNAFGAARAEAIAKGEKEFTVDGETYPVESVDDEDKTNAEEFVKESKNDLWSYLIEKYTVNEDLRTDIKKYIKSNKKEIDVMADQDNWEGIYSMLMKDFEVREDDVKMADEIKTIFNVVY
jgi:gas vesicle protein